MCSDDWQFRGQWSGVPSKLVCALAWEWLCKHAVLVVLADILRMGRVDVFECFDKGVFGLAVLAWTAAAFEAFESYNLARRIVPAGDFWLEDMLDD